MDILRLLVVIAAVVSAGLCIFFALNHEADEETLEFTSEPGELTTDSKNFYMVFDGRADEVEFSFGDGSSAKAFEVFKSYENCGDYVVLCKASNDNGERVSTYTLHIVENEHGILDGYGKEIGLLVTSVVLMLTSWFMRS